MNSSVIRLLIFKDWRLHREHIVFSVTGGVLALGMFYFKGEVPAVLGAVWFFIALIILGSMLPVSNVVTERKKQNLAFMMSLPVSAMQYTTSKIVSTFGMFLVPWLTLVAGALSLIASRSDMPHGIIPIMLVLAGLVLVGFSIIAGAAIASESEGWTIAATVVCNSSYGIGWYLISRIPAIRQNMTSPVAVWSPVVLMFLGVEFAIVVLSVALTLYLQSRKRDFI